MQKEQLPYGIRSSNQMRQILGVSKKYFQIILNRFSILVTESEHVAYYSKSVSEELGAVENQNYQPMLINWLFAFII